MRIRGTLWFGFILGFLFGTIGIWVLAMLSLALPPVEMVSSLFFLPGMWLAQFLEHDGSLGSGGVTMLMLFNGALYGLLGSGIQWSIRRTRT